MRNFLFVCYEHQYIHFLCWHIDAINRLPNHNADYLLCDSTLGLSRSGARDIPSGIIALRKHLKDNHYDSVISITPKAGLLVSISVAFSGVPQVHWFTGQVWANDRMLLRFLKRMPDLVISIVASKLLCDSSPQRKFLLANGFHYFKRKLVVPGAGSICGVDDSLFSDTSLEQDVTSDTPIRFGIVGRINEEKGILWLLKTIETLLPHKDKYRFVFIGSIDGSEFCKNSFLKSVTGDNAIEFLREISDKRTIYSSFDVLLCCSYREGFSNTIIEAQAFSKPVIVRDIYGVKSTYIEGETGVCFDTEQQLLEKLDLFSNYQERVKFGKRGHTFAKDNFKRSRVIQNCLELYNIKPS